jgi:hypothetical protein
MEPLGTEGENRRDDRYRAIEAQNARLREAVDAAYIYHDEMRGGCVPSMSEDVLYVILRNACGYPAPIVASFACSDGMHEECRVNLAGGDLCGCSCHDGASMGGEESKWENPPVPDDLLDDPDCWTDPREDKP